MTWIERAVCIFPLTRFGGLLLRWKEGASVRPVQILGERRARIGATHVVKDCIRYWRGAEPVEFMES